MKKIKVPKKERAFLSDSPDARLEAYMVEYSTYNGIDVDVTLTDGDDKIYFNFCESEGTEDLERIDKLVKALKKVRKVLRNANKVSIA